LPFPNVNKTGENRVIKEINSLNIIPSKKQQKIDLTKHKNKSIISACLLKRIRRENCIKKE
jgi:hypothetical protein